MYKILLSTVFLFTAISASLAAPTMPQISSGDNDYWYHIVFRRTGESIGDNLALEDKGEDAIVTVQTIITGNDNQLWKVEASSTNNQYIITSKAGRKIYWDNATTDPRFRAGNDNTPTNIIFNVSGNTTYTDSWELERVGAANKKAMNPYGGSSVGKGIGEFDAGDAGNTLRFVPYISQYCISRISAINVTSDNTRSWETTEMTVLSQKTTYDAKISESATIGAGAFYRGVNNTAALNVYKNKEVSLNLNGGFNWLHMVVYADWNGDGTFDPISEKIGRVPDENAAGNPTSRTLNFTVPSNSKAGETRIRVFVGWFEQTTDPKHATQSYYSPCLITGQNGASPQNGRAYDYLIYINPESNTWLGATDTDWNKGSNWSAGIAPPTSSAIPYEIIIPSGATNMPIISNDVTLGTNFTLKVEGGAKLTVAAGKQLTVSGSAANNGSIVLQSNATDGTATVVGNVSGTATVHQAINKYRSWYMSLPVSSVSGNTGVAGYSTFTESSNVWSSLSTDYSGLTAGTGVAINPTNSVTSLSFTGTLNNGDVTLSNLSSGNKRWHYVGNPYPSYLAWSALSKTNLEETVWFRTAEGNTYKYATWNGELGTPYNLISDGVIAPLQGFWVQVKSGQTGSLGFINAMRSHHSAGNKHLRAPQVSDRSILRLTVSNGTLSDEAVVYFSALNSDSRDSYDAAKMMNGNNIPEIYTLLNNEALVINAMANISYGVELPLGFNTKVAGNFTISASEFSHFAADDRVLLLDKSNNSLTDLSLGAYSFESGATTTNDRFAIKLVPGSATGIDKTTDGAYIFANNNRQLVVSLAGANEGASIRIYTVAGQQIAAQALTTRVTTLRAPLNNGAYVVEIINGGKQSVQRVIVK